ncbi:MAG: TrkH family potassium uptake protein [Bauldia sp.]|nr:TrkH family potassium uptake protein [Bauldia sp.]
MLPKVWPAVLALGWICLAVGAAQGLMALFSLAVSDGMEEVFAGTAAITIVFGGACVLTTSGRHFELRFRDAALLTVVSWFVVPAFGGLPLLAAPANLTAVDAYFEFVSGMTTTGSTVMSGLDNLPPSILLWRSTGQWIGGIGIIGLAIVILPFLKVGGMQLFRLESSDRSDKGMPRTREIAAAVGRVYVILTVACFFAYWLLGMSAFDALNHAMTTLPTAGYSTHDSSFGYFNSPALEWAGVVFMALAGLPFLAYLQFARRGSLWDRVEPQIPTFLATMTITTVLLAVWLTINNQVDFPTALTKSAFNTVSVITTTGFASVDYLQWGPFVTVWFLALTFFGGCAGSTAGGPKVFRYQVMFRVIAQHIRKAIHPHAVVPLRYGTRTLSDEQVWSVGAFMFLYFAAFAVIAVLLACLGLDVATAISGAATSIGNVGPGIGSVIGPAGNFASLPDAAKLILAVAMIMGRLEILSILLLLMPSFYR